MTAALWVLLVAGYVLATWKWLRVAQREHYAPGRVSRMALIWLRARPVSWLQLAVVAAAFVASARWPWAAIIGIAAATVFPWGLAIASRTTPLAFTGRVWRLTAVLAVIEAVVVAAPMDPRYGVLGLALLPLLTDLALAITRPVEAAMAGKYVTAARKRLRDVSPTVVAITGSYGKTSTKGYAAALIADAKRVLASPASFNNLLGLSKAVNDGLAPGTEVFIAEMGTYGPGEIRRLCEMFTPSIAAITTIGEAHLERMGSRETIVKAKSEIVETARTAILNVDVPELAELADRIAGEKTVLRCSASTPAGAAVAVVPDGDRWRVHLDGEPATELPAPRTGYPINLAIAVAIALAVGVDRDRVVATVTKLADSLAPPSHRAEVSRAADGTVVIDDTYNANPEGAAAAIRSARELAAPGATVWTVTPGMIELGHNQVERNRALGAQATAEPHMRLVITGYVNRRALLDGATDRARVLVAKDRQAAMVLVQRDLAPGDVVLYENDLPSHYP
ncbi:UDP-N-acetylmuramoyl-tripeptide--D-alanyl-D-alanine ligase [Mycobacterium sp. MYCO198283]|uniref:Mur ligase family protein n=1 Tax=Mycobacterium sp. MYCO198283 TaxID=2883505 RepID=UPI001E4A85ED|nr:UDP-N-acetylmuramoyl-tripeptide--D-alanyl-D-alanine ligase [Mycobacterium sp. MYCO198283]MCG5432242.1 UDP-N-acetylmuramoyl-tripeptide--D-alanyl-D-alanine ligase [Mycobacterium sp. MYCO198283]